MVKLKSIFCIDLKVGGKVVFLEMPHLYPGLKIQVRLREQFAEWKGKIISL